MKTIRAILLSFIYILYSLNANSEPYCFKFTWKAMQNYDLDVNKSTNCSSYKGVPCAYPMLTTEDSKPPNTTAMWMNDSINKNIRCPLKSGYFCIKYTYIYNEEVINITRYCGKVIEDRITTIKPACYKQQLDGHTIEACACQSNNDDIPCNNSNKNNHVISIILLGVFVSFTRIFNT